MNFPLNKVNMLIYQENNGFTTSVIAKSLETGITLFVCVQGKHS